MNNQKVPAPTPAVLLPVARREPERSEGDRSATGSKTGREANSHPDPEVLAQAKRRTFTADYKQRILSEADQAKGSGGVGALLRREGLYSSLLTTWRRERAAGARQALSPHKRGPKSKRDPIQERIQKLQKDNARLTEQLRKAEIVIDVQKKVGALLGWPIHTPDPDEKP
jgi:transposase-like protein